MTDFTLPELGENVATGDVLRVLVKAGDVIAKDQPVLELETDKATIEVPSSVAGRVKEIKVKAGDKVKVGQAILAVDSDASSAGAAGAEKEKEKAPEKAKAKDGDKEGREKEKGQREKEEEKEQEEEQEAEDGKAEVDEEKEEEEEEEQEADDAGQAEAGEASRGKAAAGKASAGKAPVEKEPASDGEPAPERRASSAGDKVVAISRGTRQAAEPAAPELPVAPAAPSVRRMARELGVDINQVAGSGSGGRISVDDVKEHAKRIITEPAARGGGGVPAEPLPDFSRWGEIERQPMRAVRRKTAEHLSAAWAHIPHVTQHDLADVTSLEELRKRYGKLAEAAGGNLTVTAIAVKVAAAALKVFPRFNSSIDLAADQIIQKHYVNIGVAVDTDRGLLVPVIRDADAKNLVQISVELSQLSEKARSRKITLDEMQGGCFSVSNLGGIGGTSFTPIVNAPEVAILGISRARMEPVYDKASGQFVPRLMLPLSLSYDHRVIDGADGARFLRWVAEALEQPFVLALQG